MPIINNTESNAKIEIILLNNSSLDIDKSREDFLNWIPFRLKVNAGDMVLKYSKDVLPAFSVRELKYLINNLNKIIETKSKGNSIERPFEFTSSENLFDLVIYETGEEKLIYIDFWVNMGSLTNGNVFGFSKGVRFVTELEKFTSFVYEFEEQFARILDGI
ncbi:MAG: hypothetical protein AAGU27_23970 [Dehalobacterium sp.]